MVHLGGAPGGHPALTTGTAGATTNLRASKRPTNAHRRRHIALGPYGQGMIGHESAGMLSGT